MHKENLKLYNETHLILNWFRIKSMLTSPGIFLRSIKLCFLDQASIIAKLVGTRSDDKFSFTNELQT